MFDYKTQIGKYVIVAATVVSVSGCSSFEPQSIEPEVAGFTARLSAQLETAAEPLTGVLTPDAAVTRALRFNQNLRAKELETVLAEAKVQSQSNAMLPSLIAESSYYRRDRPLLSHSSQSSGYSASSDIASVSRNIALSWNILDFGLSYVRAKQVYDKAQQQHEEARRVRARIVEETRTIYWRAVALETLAPALTRLNVELDAALRLSRTAAKDPQIDPMASITYQRDALNLQREMNVLQSSLAGATDQLKQTIGVPHLERLQLSSDRQHARLAQASSSATDDLGLALRQRPEIRYVMYDMRITHDEVDAVILQLLPGVTFNTTSASDTNSYLLHANWTSWGARIAGNAINLLRLPADLEVVEAQQQVHRQTALATAALIAMQVHVARARLVVQRRAYLDAIRFVDVQRSLLHQVRVAVRSGKLAAQALVREKLSTLLAETRAILAFADLSAAHAGYATAIGEEPELDADVHARRAAHLEPAIAIVHVIAAGNALCAGLAGEDRDRASERRGAAVQGQQCAR